MDDSFRARADRVFGSLNTTSSASDSPAPWRLTEKKIERRECRQSRDHDDEEETLERHRLSDVVSRSIVSQNQLEPDLLELSDEEKEKENDEDIVGEKIVQSTGDDAADEFANVQANIGRDCTLDYEEEEDEYDKVAVDKDHTVDRLYMRDVSDYGIQQFTPHSELPNSFHSTLKDPRANHEAAKARLKEDAEAAGDLDTLLLIDKSNQDQRVSRVDGEKPKPILKRKENPEDSRSQKRVRFSVDVKSGTDTNKEQQLQEAGDSVSVPGSTNTEAVPEQTSVLSQYLSSVPDYIRNPSRYTRYTFDSTNDMDDQSNRQVHRDFFSHVRKEKSGDDSTENDIPVEIPKSIVFTPRKKSEDDSMGKNGNECGSGENHGTNKGPSTLVSAEEAQEDKTSAMEEDEPPPVMVNKQKQGRHYRTRMNADLDDDMKE